MEALHLAVVPPFEAPPDAQLVVFAGTRNWVAEYDARSMLSCAAAYARRYGVFVLPERFAVQDHLCLCLISPQAQMLGVSCATHLNMDLRGHFRRGDSIEPIETPFGRIVLLVDTDIYFPQVARAAVEAGAQLLLSSQFIAPFDFFEDRIQYGAVNAALSNGVPVVSVIDGGACIVGADGRMVSHFSEELPLLHTFALPLDCRADREAIRTGRTLLLSHRKELLDELEEALNV
jgi:predicted amidohydrolase